MRPANPLPALQIVLHPLAAIRLFFGNPVSGPALGVGAGNIPYLANAANFALFRSDFDAKSHQFHHVFAPNPASYRVAP